MGTIIIYTRRQGVNFTCGRRKWYGKSMQKCNSEKFKDLGVCVCVNGKLADFLYIKPKINLNSPKGSHRVTNISYEIRAYKTVANSAN